MERGLHFVSISLVLLFFLRTLVGFGTSHSQGSAIVGEPQSVTRGPSLTSEEDGPRAMERGLREVGAPVIAADVTVEDDDNGPAAGEADEAFGESGGDVRSR